MSLWQSLNQCGQLYPETRKLNDLEINTRYKINLVKHIKSKGREFIMCELRDPKTRDIFSVFLPDAFAARIRDNIPSFENELRSYDIYLDIPKAGEIVYENGETRQQ
ncbi:hypothetical protein QAD02_007245 [Eretmocerus hayati]|uniref:Uncharacterized protein n=1 Tax=Eretmocerus hayati TaxID=131215 RepID=A0ACC2N4D3_9HYME|nr:hypothetical protein QAD02_007245 [Eretmocerus hayati]